VAQLALVVDDSMIIRHTVCRFLEQRGFAVESASNGAEALLLAQRLRPCLIVTDLQMPQMSGAELITVLRANPRTSSIPIVVLAGRSSGFQTYRESRADHVIFKDIDIVEQLDRVLAATFSHSQSPAQS
jgi:CheY-like chemotaxis protein